MAGGKDDRVSKAASMHCQGVLTLPMLLPDGTEALNAEGAEEKQFPKDGGFGFALRPPH